MCKAMEDFAREYAEEYARDKEIKTAIKMAVKYGAPKESIIADLCSDYGLTDEEAEKAYEEYMGMVLA